MVSEEIAPIVSGISPAEGPPGTVVKIRGENLGKDSKDVMRIYICNVNCTYTAEWKSSRLIQVRTGMGLGMGDIIVFTKNGGMGTSLVKFRGYMPRVGLLTEAAVWVDESKLFEEKPSSTLSKSRVYSPNSSLQTDPLGVAPEETGAVLPADKIEEWYPKCSSNPLSENFDPSRFLLERHLDTSFGALKSGYYHLQSQDTRTSVGPTSFVRGNLTTILDSLHTLNDIQKSMLKHESESHGGNICEELEGVLKSCNFASNSLFKDILARKDEADAKRNVLSVLHRYRFLFNLPRSIEKNMKQGEYEILISDYNRVKALFQTTEVKSFKKALSDIDVKINAFSTKLKHKLFDFPTPLEEQKKIIRYLNDLDYPGNAAWECISRQTLWIKSMLLDCQVEHQIKDSRLMSPPTSTFDVREKANEDLASQPPQGILMVNDLCKVIMTNLPDLWNLGQTYLSNQLGDKKSEIEKSNKDRENLQAIVKDVLIVCCEMIQNVLQPDEIGKPMSSEKEKKMKLLIPYLPNTVKSVRSTLDRLNKLGLTPDVVLPLKSLSTSLTADCVRKILQTAHTAIHNLYKDEHWDLDYSQKMYNTTKLPMMIEKEFTDAVKFVHKFLKDSRIDTKNESRVVHNDVVKLLKKSLKEFPIALAKTIFPDANGSTESLDQMDFKTNISPDTIAKDTKVLLLLSNCSHMKNVILPRIFNECIKNGFHELQDIRKDIIEHLDDLDKHVFSTYIDLNGQPLVDEIEMGMQVGGYSWNNATQQVRGVRRYVQDILMKFVSVHNQISSVSTIFISRIFNVLCEIITNEIRRIFQSIANFSSMGALQARLECNAIKCSLQFYLSDKANRNLANSLANVPALDEQYKKKMEVMLEHFQRKMQYQLATFNEANDYAPVDKTKEVTTTDSKQANVWSDTEVKSSKKSNAENDREVQTWKAQLKVNKNISPEEKPNSELDNENKLKKTKRKAPLPPQSLAAPQAKSTLLAQVTADSSSNPFLDDGNPFEDKGNPFEDNGNPFEDNGNPFEEEDDTSNPFLD